MHKFTPSVGGSGVNRHELLLTPDTGFQMYFFPLRAGESSQITNVPPELRDTVEHNRAVVDWQDNEELQSLIADHARQGWVPCEQVYARGRVGSCVHGNVTMLGVWLAIETNVGDAYRSWSFEPPCNPTSAERSHFTKYDKPFSPYHASSVHELDTQEEIGFQLGKGCRIDQAIIWKKIHPVDAELDLVIDFGNSRTCALVLERVSPNSIGGGDANFSQICRPVPLAHPFYYAPLLTDDGVPHAAGLPVASRDAASIVSSRFTLKRPEFRDFDPDSEYAKRRPFDGIKCLIPKYVHGAEGFWLWKKPTRSLDTVEVKVPHMFVKNSPVCLGADMEEMIAGVTELGKEFRRLHRDGVQVQQSSAKRFFWDSEPLQKAWSVVPNPGDEMFGKPGTFETLSGLMLRFQKLPGTADERPPIRPSNPNYPRRDSLTWTILSILETAHRTINSEAWVKQTGVFQRRKIRNVIGTYPSGWTKTEIAEYQSKWQEAVDIYYTTHCQNGDPQVGLVMKLDESVASQIPVLYSCMTRMANNKVGENWIQINGVSVEGKQPSLRIMNIDIGGGTTDVSIVEYCDKVPGVFVDLEATVLFKDSSTIAAGDVLLKKLVEHVVLRELSKTSGDPEATQADFRRYFTKTANVAERASRVSLLISVLLPMATSLLRQRSDGRGLDCNPALAGVSTETWAEFKSQFGLALDHNSSIPVSPEEFDALVVEVFGVYIRSLAKHAAAFDVHMLFICGKPSEQPAIRQMIERLIPVPLERIQFARGFKAGKWYPFSDGADAAISDAKTVTCVGAALERAMTDGMILNWKLTSLPRPGFKNMWGVMPNRGAEFNSLILRSDQDESSEVVLNVTNRIGRKMLDGVSCEPEPVYRLLWNDGRKDQTTVKASFMRIPQEQSGADSIALRQVIVQQTGEDVTAQVSLKLYPLLHDQEPWQDTGELDLS